MLPINRKGGRGKGLVGVRVRGYVSEVIRRRSGLLPVNGSRLIEPAQQNHTIKQIKGQINKNNGLD